LAWAESPIGPGIEAITRHLAELNHCEFDAYLRSLIATYEKWWTHYTLTDATGKAEQPAPEQPPIFDFGLMVQAVQNETPEREANPSQEKREKIERLPVLEGIRKYADDHVLLVGRPGSGKSTALIRLLLEEATALTPSPSPKLGRGEPEKIPVLVELRYWQDSIEGLMQGFLKRHGLTLDDSTLSKLLDQGRFLLLIDGLNELPSEGARTQLTAFRRNHPKVPMIFTTRDLGLGGDLGMEKKLEMQPLTEPQMKEFIRAYVPDQADAMLRQLNTRLREFGQTPLLLWMLCEVFQQSPNRQMPNNLAEVFRIFTKGYGESAQLKHEVAALKGDVKPLSDRRLWTEALITLAARMMQGETPVDFRVAIPRTEAERELGGIFANENFPTRDILDDLLKYHLLQNSITDQLEFRHQLIQEYYAAEYLLRLLPNLSNKQLKRDYLNLLKWTEPIALMLSLMDDEAQALRVVKLPDDFVRAGATEALGQIGSDVAIPGLLKLLEHPNSDIRQRAILALAQIKGEIVIQALLTAVHDPVFFVRWRATEDFGGEAVIMYLFHALEHLDSDSFPPNQAKKRSRPFPLFKTAVSSTTTKSFQPI
jgi:predicted NACHT family NTPase